MNLEEGILTRRSIRKYQKNNRISKEDTEALLNMAMHAPSALNTQPWEFIVVDDQNVFNKIMAVHPYCSFLKDASLAIVVCGNRKSLVGGSCARVGRLLVRNLSDGRKNAGFS